jgi:hypothetical protein
LGPQINALLGHYGDGFRSQAAGTIEPGAAHFHAFWRPIDQEAMGDLGAPGVLPADKHHPQKPLIAHPRSPAK